MNPHEPGPPPLFTMIMNAIVMPRATSSERSRLIGVGAGAETVAALKSSTPCSQFCADQNPVQCDVDVIIRAAEFLFLQKALFCQRIQIFGGGQARDLKIAFNECDLGIRMREQIVDQILTVEFVLIA